MLVIAKHDLMGHRSGGMFLVEGAEQVRGGLGAKALIEKYQKSDPLETYLFKRSQTFSRNCRWVLDRLPRVGQASA
jgi:hypothetical protein